MKALRVLLAPALASAVIQQAPEGKSAVLLSTKEVLTSQDEADPSKRFHRVPVTVSMALSKMDSDFDELDSKENAKEESRLAVAKIAAEKVRNLNLGEHIQAQALAASEQMRAEEKAADEIQADLNVQKSAYEKASAKLKHRLDKRTAKLKASVEQKKKAVADKEEALKDAEKAESDIKAELTEDQASMQAAQKDVQTFEAEVQEKQSSLQASQKQLRVARKRAHVASAALEAAKSQASGLKNEADERKKEVGFAQTAANKTEVTWQEHLAKVEMTDQQKADELAKEHAAAAEAAAEVQKKLEEHGTLLLQAQKKQKELKEQFSKQKAEELQATASFEDRRREAEAGEVSQGDWAWTRKA
mmetsp:Transcript_34795/g.63354  ORF Transcript_34795/g.63354 Transcript_34795/m.63354 type:complete len:360 (-) Transcript_34795:168-1247(-)|eukprot:CAMPEP_0197624874 /NCGR_PEP_ID=MMETSP1338-20131121/4385_1 /TAXON_ID=43686 ORGANISM="Pelagodinium beii, Strain RCC1491" /NCGR_SAMPLE_ID=MMETSP1338 /ASSEMBLY_ACC=CAM_ASM_000754 /LENGTH=359 /DNA_ID=CAMNT_0043195125 /DNA_START=40 /DNA_END=1119 /DNA_ORIENTATION=-